MRAPSAPRKPVSDTRHGHVRTDDYAWLRSEFWREAAHKPDLLEPEIRAYLEAENAYTDLGLADTEALQKRLYAEMRARIKEEDASVPADDGAWSYYRRFAAGAEHPVYCRKPASGGDEQVLLDCASEAQGKAYYRVSAVEHDQAQRLLAYGEDLTGAERYIIRFRDLASGAMLADALDEARGDMAWSADGRHLFYTVLDERHRPTTVRRHTLGTDPARDALIYREADAGFYTSVGLTESRRFIVIVTHDHTTSELRVIDAADPEAAPRVLIPRTRDVEYDVTDNGARWFIRTNADGAQDFKVVSAPLDDASPARWEEVVPHRPGRLILGLLCFKDYLVHLEREDGLPRIVIRRLADGDEHAIAFDEEAYDLSLVPGYAFDTPTLRFAYSSMTTPQEIFDYDMAARTRTLRKIQEVPSGHDPAAYVTRRLYALAPDGERVPVSVLHRKDVALDGSAPCLLYGYGAYGISIPAAFSTNRLSLVDRGFVYAIAHIRGGMERGYRWYSEGRAFRKKNTFTDFIAAAEHLIAERYTARGRIAAHGGSAGGMLMGAVANMRPDLFKAIVAEVPFVDVLNTMLDATLPLTPPEWPDWGNPILDAKAYGYIRSYSPYDNVSAQAYPAIFALGGLSDPRVTYWEPAKWIAKLRALRTDDNLTLLRINMDAGHAGAPGRFERLEEVALVYAFLFKVFGVKA